MESTLDIISDDEVARVHANANFGSLRPRAVLNEGVTKVAFGYSCGYTQETILEEHGLIYKRRPDHPRRLTKKGYRYLRAAYAGRFSEITCLTGSE